MCWKSAVKRLSGDWWRRPRIILTSAMAAGDGSGVDSQKVCGFFLQHKGRPCRMLVKAGRRYCGQHLVEENVVEVMMCSFSYFHQHEKEALVNKVINLAFI